MSPIVKRLQICCSSLSLFLFNQKRFLLFIKNSVKLFPGQGSGDADRKPLQQAEAGPRQEGREQERDVAGPLAQDRRSPEEEGHAVPHRRHHVLLRLRAHAQAPAHPRSREVLRRFRHPQGLHGPVALHVPHVPTGCVHPELPGRPGHHQPLQASAGHEDEEARGAGDAHVHNVHPHRHECENRLKLSLIIHSNFSYP